MSSLSYSADCGINFIKAGKRLKELYGKKPRPPNKLFHTTPLPKEFRGILINFMHQNLAAFGRYSKKRERHVKSAEKIHYEKLPTHRSSRELQAALVNVGQPGRLDYLTPGHFIIGSALRKNLRFNFVELFIK